jgi:DNA-binding NtrC family response regulator
MGSMQERTTDAKSPSVLAVMDPVLSRALIQQIEEQGVRVIAVAGRDEAQRMLRRSPQVPIVLTAETLPDGDWRDVLHDVAAAGVAAAVVVCAGPDQPLTLSFELLDRGAFGLLAEPFDRDQLLWLINTATSRSRLYH